MPAFTMSSTSVKQYLLALNFDKDVELSILEDGGTMVFREVEDHSFTGRGFVDITATVFPETSPACLFHKTPLRIAEAIIRTQNYVDTL